VERIIRIGISRDLCEKCNSLLHNQGPCWGQDAQLDLATQFRAATFLSAHPAGLCRKTCYLSAGLLFVLGQILDV